MIEAYFSGLSLDKKFQDWMVEKTLMVRSPDTEEQLRERFGNPHLSRTDKELWEILFNKRGYIMGTMEIAEDWAQIRDVNMVPSLDGIKTYIHRLRYKTTNPNIIATVNGLGYGVGIEGVVVKPTEAYLLSRFYRYNKSWLSKEELARWLYGEHDTSTNFSLRQQISFLNKLLIPRGIHIRNSYSSPEGFLDTPIGGGYYRLHEEPQEKQLKMAV